MVRISVISISVKLRFSAKPPEAVPPSTLSIIVNATSDEKSKIIWPSSGEKSNMPRIAGFEIALENSL